MFRQVVGTILRLAVRNADDWLPIRGSHSVPGLRLRADDRPAAARGEHAPPPLRVPRRLADADRDVAIDAVARVARGRAGAGGRGRPAGRCGAGPPRHRRRRGVDQGNDARDGRGGQHVPLPGRPVGQGRLRPRRHRAQPEPSAGEPGRGARADLLRAGRLVRHREPAHHDRAGGGSGRAPGARIRAAQAVPGPTLDAAAAAATARQHDGKTADEPPVAAPCAHPDPGRQPRHGRGADPARRGDARPSGRRAVGAGHRRSARGDAAVRGRDPRPARPPATPEGPRLRPRRDAHPSHRPHRAARVGGDHRGVRRAGVRPHHLRLGRQGTDRQRRSQRRPDGLLTDHRRGRPRVALRYRGRQAAWVARHQARPGPGPRRTARRAGDALRRRHRDATTAARSSCSTSCRRASRWPSEPRPNGRSPRFIKQHLKGKGEAVLREAPNVRNAILREAEKADLVVMGASAVPGRRWRGLLPVRRPARGDRGPCQAVGRRRQDPRGDRRRDVRHAGVEGGVADRRRPGSRGGPRRAGPRRALVRRIELPPRRVR